ncbi:MAG: cob(I)yrinic acid a,c-diamide adenosyltransferase [Nitrospinota bacterium]
MDEDIKGLNVIFTGEGKGKTSAAMGVVLRAVGHGFKCRVIQFIKGSIDTGELHTAEKLAPQLEIVRAGKGFTWSAKVSPEEHKAAAQHGIEEAKKSVADFSLNVVVLDEILYALSKNLIGLEQVKELMETKHGRLHLILTGRGAPDELIDMADMVTTMRETKHPYKKGIPAQKGLDY